MIRQVSGIIADLSINSVIVDVNGIGYLVYTNLPVSKLIIGEKISFFTYLAVRETALDLYGFATRDELEVFELLIDLPKIGPKSGLQFLTQADIKLIKEAVTKNDAVYLTKMSGISKKSAEKIVDGLKDKFEFSHYDTDGQVIAVTETQHATDTVDALLTLGYSQNEARAAVQKITEDFPELTKSNEVLKLALKFLSR